MVQDAPQNFPAEEAYARMRRTAMNEKRKVAEIAPATAAAAETAK
jgi:AmiR/NasT family two-component response regulator